MQKASNKAKGGAIFVHHVVIRVGHRRHLGFTMNINLCKLVRPVVFFKTSENTATYYTHIMDLFYCYIGFCGETNVFWLGINDYQNLQRMGCIYQTKLQYNWLQN